MRNKPEIISIMFDLSSQKERVDFMKNYAEFCKKRGYNTIILGLNASVRTSVTPFFNVDDSYSKDEIRDLVDSLEAIGLDVIPAFENLFHMEKILAYKELEEYSEFTDEQEQGRKLSSPKFKRGSAGCPTNEKLRAFTDAYIKEVCSLFKSKYVHMGMDESFEFAECPRCKAFLKNGNTKEDLFRDLIIHNRELVRSLGREMMMWSDFIEYYDVLDKIPNDVIMCHWDYYFIGYEPRGKWTGRIKKDWFRIYDDLGFRYMFCSKAMETSSAYNIETLTEYADKFKPFGAMMTTWEKSATFYECLKPAIAYGGRLWNADRNEKIDLIGLYADFLDGDRELANVLTSLYEPEIAFGYFDVVNVVERRHHVICAFKSHLKYVLGEFEKRNVSLKNGGNPVLCDIYDNLSERYAMLSLSSLGDRIFDDYEADGVTDTEYYNGVIDEAIKRFKASKENGDILYERDRKGIVSYNNAYEDKYRGNIALAEKIRGDISAVKGKRFNVFCLDLMLPDTYSMIKGELIVKYKGNAEETAIYSGTVKTILTAFDVSGVYTLCFRLENNPIEYAVFNSYGEGDIFPVHFAYFNGKTKLDAIKCEKLYGRVINEQNVLSYDVAFAEMGYGNGREHIDDMSLAKKKSGIKVYFE